MKNSMFALILLLALMVSLPTAGFGQTRVTVQLDGLPKTLVKNKFSLVVRAVEVETVEVASTVRFTKASGTVRVSGKPTKIFADYADLKRKRLVGASTVLRPIAGKKYKLKIKLRNRLTLARRTPSIMPRTALLPAGSRVGIPSARFTASGPGTGDHMARGEATMLISDLAQAPCYRNGFRNDTDFHEGERFTILEVEPDKLAELQNEIDRTQTPAFDQRTRLTNRWMSPNVMVSGQLVSDGTNLSITVDVSDLTGNRLFSESASGPASKWFDTHQKLANKLKAKFCEEGSVRITQKSCQPTSCRCCDLEDPVCYGRWWEEKWRGTAEGPVGSVFDVNIVANPNYGNLSCGGWDEYVTANLRGCKRSSEGQPQSISFEATRYLFPPSYPIHCLCPVSEANESTFLAEILTPESKYSADEQRMNCPQ